MCLTLSLGAAAQEEGGDYRNIETDLANGLPLQDVADRALDNADDYWAKNPAKRDGDDDELSAGEAVTAIYTEANALPNADPQAKDIVKINNAVVDAATACQDTFDSVRAAVELRPNRADEVAADIAVKRDCNCGSGGLWLDQRVDERTSVEMRHDILEVPAQYSCSQVAMYAAVAGLPENREWKDDLPEEQKAALIASMTEKVTVITERVAAEQSFNGWECGATDVNIAAAMQGIKSDELREGTYDGLAQKYADEAGDSGLVVDSFGIVGKHPAVHWGDGEHVSSNNVLRRKGEIHRGDNLILDPFHPATEFTAHGDRNHEHLDQHAHSSAQIPTDVFISEYVDGWNQEARAKPENERDPDQRNRVIELYNGTDRPIDLGDDQYFLEIYSGPGGETETVATPPVFVKKTISLQSDVTFDFDKSDIRADASEDLQKVIQTLNDTEIFSEILISGHTCDMGSDEYNLGLSKRRADSVRDYLQANGLKDVTIRTEGLGEAQPRIPNTSAANRSRNRRVDLTFVTQEGAEIEKTVSQADANSPKVTDITFLAPIPATVHEVESEPAGTMAPGEYSKGDMNPRQAIGLNGKIEPGQVFIIAYSESDDEIKDVADVVTSQLDFKPSDTILLRRLGGEMAMNCRAQAYSFVTNYPDVPLIRFPPPIPVPPPRPPEIASPN